MNPAVTPLPPDRKSMGYQYFVGGAGEVVNAAAYPWGWERPEFDDRSWAAAGTITPADRAAFATHPHAGFSCRAASR